MDRNVVKVLLGAWERPDFRAGLQHLIDLDEVTSLLAALAVDDHDDEVRRRSMELLRSALETAEIRRAVLLLIETDDIRHSLVTAISDNLADRPGLASSVRSALDDPAVRTETREALESPKIRALLWKVAEDEFRGHRLTLVGQVTLLLVRHRPARRLVWALKRHGVIRELRRKAAPS
ncbi:hypothetical protein Ais01nite_10810 [Asanoa ishikariensis]|uniref:Uncharacterized protein n=1 Tax=Asanoa ishikariensis TaxID=137265 RepID=A0A1H3T369_9ACTN|nr:hypothetical protein [Asanoa ishikariensis]GIF63046.1 hypothetical protein Ais01nite_10810 [Asanoa ishikariensis]SDZ44793.1 hypothetical protein SAMN05421684_5147 [Asanoa ishikariensis]